MLVDELDWLDLAVFPFEGSLGVTPFPDGFVEGGFVWVGFTVETGAALLAGATGAAPVAGVTGAALLAGVTGAIVGAGVTGAAFFSIGLAGCTSTGGVPLGVGLWLFGIRCCRSWGPFQGRDPSS